MAAAAFSGGCSIPFREVFFDKTFDKFNTLLNTFRLEKADGENSKETRAEKERWKICHHIC